MRIDGAAYHEICTLPLRDAASPAEADTWNKYLLETANAKLKVQRDQLRVELFRSLQRRGVGLNEVEQYAKKSTRFGARYEVRRRRTVQLIMRGKREDAMVQLAWSKEKFVKKMAKLEGRWGRHRAIMTSFRAILRQGEVRGGKEGGVSKGGGAAEAVVAAAVWFGGWVWRSRGHHSPIGEIWRIQ